MTSDCSTKTLKWSPELINVISSWELLKLNCYLFPFSNAMQKTYLTFIKYLKLFFSEPAFLWLEQLWCSDQDWSKCQMGSRQRKGILLVDQKAWKRSLLQSFQTLKAEVKESAGSEDQILLANQMQESHEDPK